jgi:hypothetical protein
VSVFQVGGRGWVSKFVLRHRQRWTPGGPWETREAAQEAEATYRRRLKRMSAVAQDRRANAEQEPHTVYRYYAGDELLYVGLTGTAFRRTSEHRKDREWWPLVTRAEFDHFEGYTAAAAHEARLIRELLPRFNQRGKPSSTTSTGSRAA